MRSILCSVLLSICLMVATPSWANRELKTFKEFVPIQMLTAASSTKSQIDESFTFKLTDDVTYQDLTFPKETIFTATISEVKPSQRFGRPAKVYATLDSVALPNGTQIIPSTAAEKDLQLRFYRDRYKNAGAIFWRQALTNLSGNVVTIPLLVATNINFLPIFCSIMRLKVRLAFRKNSPFPIRSMSARKPKKLAWDSLELV